MRGRIQDGVLLLVLAAVLVVVVAAGTPSPVAGIPTAAPPAHVPRAGDCLLAAVPTGRDPVTAPAPLAACAGARYGEVYAVVEDLAGPDTDVPDVCPRPAPDWYLRGAPGDPVLDPDWEPAVRAQVLRSGPDTRQRRAGQRWVACLVAADPPGAAATPQYGGPVRRALPDRDRAAVFAACSDVPDPRQDLAVPCGTPHRSEVVATRPVLAPGPSATDLARQCDALLRRFTGMPDPTAGGRLREVADVVGWSSTSTPSGERLAVPAGSPVPVGATGTAVCALTAGGTTGRLLGGSLQGLGHRPVPWS
ncbi:hypothetical protein GCM10011594_34000 [Nakamurella endophytica]|uniref:Septum formation-related domain-containing protein n=1 Tax=Nakamurella endophytica TaxID=1748367 RepID=A0A917T5T5_9ACTN|nr:hypothetical protein GCM10011594_34000 [Nakamurella endophytica]